MTGNNRARLSATYNFKRAVGHVVADGIRYTFSAPAVHKPSGLYRSIRSCVVPRSRLDGSCCPTAPRSALSSPTPIPRRRRRQRHRCLTWRRVPPRTAHRHRRHADQRCRRHRILTSSALGHQNGDDDDRTTGRVCAAAAGPRRLGRGQASGALPDRRAGRADPGYLRAPPSPDWLCHQYRGLLQSRLGEVVARHGRDRFRGRPGGIGPGDYGKVRASPRPRGSAACTSGQAGSRSSWPCRSRSTASTRWIPDLQHPGARSFAAWLRVLRRLYNQDVDPAQTRTAWLGAPACGALVFTVLTAVWLTSAYWFFSTFGI